MLLSIENYQFIGSKRGIWKIATSSRQNFTSNIIEFLLNFCTVNSFKHKKYNIFYFIQKNELSNVWGEIFGAMTWQFFRWLVLNRKIGNFRSITAKVSIDENIIIPEMYKLNNVHNCNTIVEPKQFPNCWYQKSWTSW